MKTEKGNVLIFCAHSDDHILGVGGTIAKYASEGISVETIIFSYGESSHPWLKSKVTIEMRVKEAKKADKVVGGSGVTFFGLKEGKFKKEMPKKRTAGIIKEMIFNKKPKKIFTHSLNDPHPDHRAVTKTVLEVINDLNQKCDVYAFDIWNPINIRKRDDPRLVIDISDTFSKKIKAVKHFSSQKLAMLTLLPGIYTRAFVNGLNNGCKFAEVFYKIK